MQGIRAIVFSQRIFFSVESEFPVGDAISIASHDGAKIRTLVEISLELIEAKNDIVELPVLVGHPQRYNDSAVSDGAHFHAMRVRNGVKVYARTVFGLTEAFLLNGTASLCNGRLGRAPVRKKADHKQSNY